nr:hypothetical protein K-LCC10_0277 [Kaumoebavirus]
MNATTQATILAKLHDQVRNNFPKYQGPATEGFEYRDLRESFALICNNKTPDLHGFYIEIARFIVVYSMHPHDPMLVHELHVMLHLIKDLQNQPGEVRLLTDRHLVAYTNYVKARDFAKLIPKQFHEAYQPILNYYGSEMVEVENEFRDKIKF